MVFDNKIYTTKHSTYFILYMQEGYNDSSWSFSSKGQILWVCKFSEKMVKALTIHKMFSFHVLPKYKICQNTILLSPFGCHKKFTNT